jgi:propanediol dehydratase small subunit
MPQYPLNESMPDQLQALSGRAYDDVTLDAVAEGTLSADDLAVDASTLRAQATISEEAGFPQLAANLRRAAELTAVPNDELLRMYELLRPGRASYDELIALAETLTNTYNADETATFVREAADAYRQRELLKRS